LKNAHLLRLRSSCFTAAYKKYASFRMISHALHLNIFEQPVCIDFFNTLRDKNTRLIPDRRVLK
jgi:hypothetical protein